jgi:hypothetical protein
MPFPVYIFFVMFNNVSKLFNAVNKHVCCIKYARSRGSSVGIATTLRAGRSGFDSRQRLWIFLFASVSRPALGPTQPPIQWVPGPLSLGAKWPGCEADDSPPSSADVRNTWSYTSTPQYVFRAWCLVKHKDDFTFTFFNRICQHFCMLWSEKRLI